MFLCECPYCDFTEESKESDLLKDRLKNHLKTGCKDDVEQEFKQGYTLKSCKRKGCNHVFAYDYEEHAGLVCPECGKDHTNWYIGMLIFTKEVIGGGATA